MGKREQSSVPLRHEPNMHSAARGLSVLITVVLAAALLVLGSALPNWLLQRRSAKYFRTTSQISVSDIHPYGDQYESMKQSLRNTIRYKSAMSGQEWTVAPNGEMASVDNGDGEEDETNLDGSDALSRFDSFLQDWNEALNDESCWITGLEMLGYTNVVPISSQNTSQADILMINAIDYSGINPTLGGSELLLDCSTGAPVYMNLTLSSYDDPSKPSPELLWSCLLSAYRSQLGIQFTEVSSTASTDNETEDSSKYESNTSAKQFSALSADQVFRLDVSIQIEQMERSSSDQNIGSVVYQIQAELSA